MGETVGASTTGQRRRGKRLGVYLGLCVSALCILWLVRSVEQEKVFHEVRNISAFEVGMAVMFTVLSYLIRSWRWPVFFDQRTLSFFDSYRCLILGFLMNNVLPARMGELVRAHLGGRATGQSRTLVLATIAGERLADGVMISAIFAVFFTLGASAEELEYGQALLSVAMLFAAAAIGTVIVIFARHQIFHLLERLQGMFPGKASRFALSRVQRFIEGLEPMLRPRKLVRIVGLSLLIWTVELAAYGEIAKAFGQPMTIGGLSLFLAAVNFSSLIPAAPAGLGVIEAFATAALAHIGLQPETALAMVLAQHLIQIAVVGIPGAFFFFTQLGGRVPVQAAEEEAE